MNRFGRMKSATSAHQTSTAFKLQTTFFNAIHSLDGHSNKHQTASVKRSKSHHNHNLFSQRVLLSEARLPLFNRAILRLCSSAPVSFSPHCLTLSFLTPSSCTIVLAFAFASGLLTTCFCTTAEILIRSNPSHRAGRQPTTRVNSPLRNKLHRVAESSHFQSAAIVRSTLTASIISTARLSKLQSAKHLNHAKPRLNAATSRSKLVSRDLIHSTSE